MTIQTVIVHWERAVDLLDVLERGSGWGVHRGVYQILEEPGENLIYIGLSKGATSTCRIRIQKHRKDWLQQFVSGEMSIRFGEIQVLGSSTGANTQSGLTGNMVELVESLLILKCQPRENTTKMNEFSYDSEIQLDNQGDRGWIPKWITMDDFDLH